jgi:hypothetical protein
MVGRAELFDEGEGRRLVRETSLRHAGSSVNAPNNGLTWFYAIIDS